MCRLCLGENFVHSRAERVREGVSILFTNSVSLPILFALRINRTRGYLGLKLENCSKLPHLSIYVHLMYTDFLAARHCTLFSYSCRFYASVALLRTHTNVMYIERISFQNTRKTTFFTDDFCPLELRHLVDFRRCRISVHFRT